MKLIPVYMIQPQSAENIAELIEMHSQSAYMQGLAGDIRKIVKSLETTGGWVVIGGERHKRENKKWTEEEEKLFAAKVRTYQAMEWWKKMGGKKKAWDELSMEFGREPNSLKSKYAQLLRRGILTDG